MAAKTHTIDMTNGPLVGKIIRFALPFMAASLIQLLFNAADIAVVGKFAGDQSQAAVTSTTSLINLVVNLFIGFGVGVNVIVARALGSGDRSRVSTVVHTAILTAILCGAMMTVVGGLAAPTILELMGSPDSVRGLAVLYLRIYFLAIPADLLYNFSNALLRAQGDTKRPMYYMIIAGVVNVVLNLIFVICFHWDVAGVAAATAISKYISAFLAVRCLTHETGILHLDLTRLKIHWPTLQSIARIGLPAGLSSAMFALSNMTIQSAINSMGEAVMAGVGAATNMSTILYTPTSALYQTTMTFTSQNLGACKPKRIDRVYGCCMCLAVSVQLVLYVSATLLGRQLMGVYTDSPEVIEVGLLYMSIAFTTAPLCSVMDMSSGTLRGLGYSMLPLTISMLGVCGLRVLWVNTVFAASRTPISLYLCYPLTWLVAAVALVCCYFVVRPKFYAKARAERPECAEEV